MSGSVIRYRTLGGPVERIEADGHVFHSEDEYREYRERGYRAVWEKEHSQVNALFAISRELGRIADALQAAPPKRRVKRQKRS